MEVVLPRYINIYRPVATTKQLLQPTGGMPYRRIHRSIISGFIFLGAYTIISVCVDFTYCILLAYRYSQTYLAESPQLHWKLRSTFHVY